MFYTFRIEKCLNNLPQKSKKFNSHKYFHGNSGFAALCCEVVFLHIQKNLLGHFSKMDKVKVCPKIQNGPRSLFNVFYVGPVICGPRRGIISFMVFWSSVNCLSFAVNCNMSSFTNTINSAEH